MEFVSGKDRLYEHGDLFENFQFYGSRIVVCWRYYEGRFDNLESVLELIRNGFTFVLDCVVGEVKCDRYGPVVQEFVAILRLKGSHGRWMTPDLSGLSLIERDAAVVGNGFVLQVESISVVIPGQGAGKACWQRWLIRIYERCERVIGNISNVVQSRLELGLCREMDCYNSTKDSGQSSLTEGTVVGDDNVLCDRIIRLKRRLEIKKLKLEVLKLEKRIDKLNSRVGL